MDQIKPDVALQNLSKCASLYKGTLEEHQILQASVQALEKLIPKELTVVPEVSSDK